MAALLVTVAGCNCEKGCAGESSPGANEPGHHTGGNAPTPRAQTNGPEQLGLRPVRIDPIWQECTEDRQCAHVPGDCCGCAAGGTDVAINWKNFEAVGKSRQNECGDTACTMVVSNDLSCRKDARCVGGKCTLVLTQQAPANGVGIEKIRSKIERVPAPPRPLPDGIELKKDGPAPEQGPR